MDRVEPPRVDVPAIDKPPLMTLELFSLEQAASSIGLLVQAMNASSLLSDSVSVNRSRGELDILKIQMI